MRSSGNTPGGAAAKFARIGTALTADVDAGLIPGAVVLVTQGGTTVYHEAFGFADRHAGRVMPSDAIFRIASMTKPVTVVAALKLLERGQLLLTDPVSRYLPALKDVMVGVEQSDDAGGSRRLALTAPRRAMTIQDLMRHTAGFTYGQFGNSMVQRAYRAANMNDNSQTNAEMVTKLAQLPLAHHPGGTFEYGMSTDVLGHVVEVVSGSALDRFLADEILSPLGLSDTGFHVPAGSAARLAEPQRAVLPGQAVPAVVPYDPERPPRWFSGGGGLVSTAADYSRFARLLLGGGELDGVRLLARKTVELMTQNHLFPGVEFGANTADLGIAAPFPHLGQGYGLGIGVRTQAALCGVPGSAGDFYWGGALGPYFWVDPQEHLTAVFMLQELNVQRRTRYRSLLRSLVYQALD
jgi:CubicO group peptidase (beta-lactamase class C family)